MEEEEQEKVKEILNEMMVVVDKLMEEEGRDGGSNDGVGDV